MIDKKALSEIKYIDRNKTLRYIEWYMLMKRRDYSNPTITLDEVMGLITDIDVADVTEVKHGEWLICCDGYYPYCSECGYEPPWVQGRDMRTNYCPECGAIMDRD